MPNKLDNCADFRFWISSQQYVVGPKKFVCPYFLPDGWNLSDGISKICSYCEGCIQNSLLKSPASLPGARDEI